jgi:Tol biopolymer transport system component
LIAVMNPDGSGSRFLCNSGATDPDWSPDGSQIVAQRDGSIIKVDADEIPVNGCDGLEPTFLTSLRSYDPAFSPGGGKIVFSSRRDGDYDLYIMDADGTNVQQITNNPAEDTLPDWQPVQQEGE